MELRAIIGIQYLSIHPLYLDSKTMDDVARSRWRMTGSNGAEAAPTGTSGIFLAIRLSQPRGDL